MKRIIPVLIFLSLILAACNFPLPSAAINQVTATPLLNPNPLITPTPLITATTAVLNGPGVKIVTPAGNATLPKGAPVEVQFISAGGPFFEADLLVDDVIVNTMPLAQDAASPSGTLVWQAPVGGNHRIVIEVFTPEKQVYVDSLQVTVEGEASTVFPTSMPTPTIDPEKNLAFTQVIKLMHDSYQIDLTAPAINRKYRPGVPNDPWVSLAFVGNWLYDIEITPDKTLQVPYPENGSQNGSPFMTPGEKSFPVCRPSGKLKILVVLLDFQNLAITRDEALASVVKVQDQINTKFAEYSTAGGAKSPILQLQLDGLFISPPPTLKDHMLTPGIIQSATGVDTSPYDLIVQVDLDGNYTYRKVLATENFETNGMEMGTCASKGLSIWISLDTKDQALSNDVDQTFTRVLSHEVLHTFGYPATHSWPCGDGSTVDTTDQCDVYNWPTLMLGWTDTDGDGIPEIIDPTPYGITP